MGSFDLQGWHILAGIGLFLLGILKTDVIEKLKAHRVIREQKKLLGKPIDIHAANGEWQRAVLADLKYERLLKKGGGVRVHYLNEDGSVRYTEKFSFDNWKNQRFRVVVDESDQ